MVGGIRYEHTHRMVASIVGLMMLILCIWLYRAESRWWVKNLGAVALGAVILQGLLGGLTVLFFLPDAISISHGVLAQTFFILTIIIAYSQSVERFSREKMTEEHNQFFLQLATVFVAMIFTQLLLGAVMRHTQSGLAIPDFPTMGGYWIPPFNQKMLANINLWHYEHTNDLISLRQVFIHFLHRFWAGVLAIFLILLNYIFFSSKFKNDSVKKTILILNGLIIVQIILGISAVLSKKEVYLTTLHVTTGATTLGVAVLLILRASPLRWNQFKEFVLKKP